MRKTLAEIFELLENEDYTTVITGVENFVPDYDNFEIKNVECDSFKQILVNQDCTIFYIPLEDYFVECRYLPNINK